ncbi:hypothetical protein M9Y10_020750 [Tritrichomonas musculus]|uniref:Helicase conserved C-terminal domain containing protein n=1 Tax=Tritrichomonas musculus TaxID=1915356 RepID=A0ABR2HEG5_9EUKA
MPPKKYYHQKPNNQSNKPDQSNKPNQSNRHNQSNKPNQPNRHNQSNKPYQGNKPQKTDNLFKNNSTHQIKKQKDQTPAKLPKFITFGDQNALPRSTLIKPWPYNKTFVVDFYDRAQVPVTFLDSSDDEQLNKHLPNHQQETIIIDLDWTQSNPLSVFEICTKKGVLIIHNSKKSDILINFIKSTPIFTKGSDKVWKLLSYINSKDEKHFIDLDAQYINPKRYPPSFDYLLRTFLGEPKYIFRPKNIRRSDWSKKNLSCLEVMCCAYKVVSEFMLIPIVQSAPRTIGEYFYIPKELKLCTQIPFRFHKNRVTKVTFIPDKEEEQVFILPMIDKLYDGKAFVVGKSDGLFGYGTSNGILITEKEISPFEHSSIEVSDDVIGDKEIKNLIRQTQWKDNHEILRLAIKISFGIKQSKKKRPVDPIKGTSKFPSFAKYKPARFEVPFNIPRPQFQSRFTILQIPVNPDLYVHFSLPVLECIQSLQESGFEIPQAKSYDIDEMCESVRIDDISDQLETDIKNLISSFKKVDSDHLFEIINDYEPRAKEEEAYFRIIDYDNINDLSETDVRSLLMILNHACKERNNYISQLCSLKEKRDDEANLIMNKLLVSVRPSEALVNKIDNYLSKFSFDLDDFKNLSKKVIKHIRKVQFDKDQKEELVNSYCSTVDYYVQFSSKQNNCYDQLQLIKRAFLNLKNFVLKDASPEEISLFVSNATKMIDATTTYFNFMSSQKNRSIRIIENLLFKLVFTPSEENSPFTQVYAVYQMHDKFLFGKNPFANFKSSTGSGKTRCAPFFFAIKAHMDDMKRPFFIMTQPGASIIADKMKDFKNVLGENNVILVHSVKQMIKLYKDEKQPSKPVIALFSPHNALRLLSEAEKLDIDIISRTRFCLDEIHERSVDTDVFIAKLAMKIKEQKTFPLQVLMMSATPDERVLKCFGKVQQLELPDSQLFPIDTIQKEVDSKNKVSNEAAVQTVEILKNMARGKKQLGHILVFTSGNSRINEINQRICDQIRNAQKTLQDEIDALANTLVCVNELDEEEDLETNDKTLRNLSLIQDIPLDDIGAFNRRVDEITKGDDTTLFVIPIKFAGFVASAQKEIAKNVIQNHENVIKIILATNAIESSITIDQLSAVVDTGIFNQPQFDTQRGLTKLSEEPISLQSRTQRKGRVGRVRPGTSVQLSIKDLPFKEFLPPEILTTDISSNILSLRKIGIKLENVQNLPDPIDTNVMKLFMEELYSIGAISKETGDLTEIGNKISQFESLSPFLAASVMKAASFYEEDQSLLEVLGSLIVLIFNSSELVIDVYAQPLQDNFNEDSDIITILKTFLDLVNKNSWKLKTPKFGLNTKAAQGIFSTTNTISNNLKVPVEESHIFAQLKNIVNKIDLMDFIQKIIDSIESYKSSWIQCRKATFMTIDNIRLSPSLIYVGGKSLAFEDDQVQSEITLSIRPGSKGLISPGAAYIFNISHNESMSINFGSCIHRNMKEDPDLNSYKFVRPKTLETDISLFAQEEFSSALLNALLQGHESEFNAFNTMRHTGNESGKAIFYPSMFKNKCVYTYAPLNKQGDQTFKDAVEKVFELMPFTPSVVLVRYPLLNCAIGINFITIDKSNSNVYFFKENNCFPYQINKDTLQYLLSRVSEFSKIDNKTFIAITGEMLSISIDSEKPINFDSIRRPTVDPKCNSVFSDDPYFYSHMVILSDTQIPGQTPIPWTKTGIYADYAPSDYITKVANGIFPDLANVKESKKRIFFMFPNNNNNPNKSQEQIEIEGNYPTSLDIDEAYYYQSTSNRPVDAMFDRFAMGCASTTKLLTNVDLKSFKVHGPTLPMSIIHHQSLKNFLQQWPIDKYQMHCSKYSSFLEKSDRLKDAYGRRSYIIEQQSQYRNLDFGSLPSSERQRIIGIQKDLKEQRNQIENEIQSIKSIQKPHYDAEDEELFKKIPSQQYYYVAQNLIGKDYQIAAINRHGEFALDVPTSMYDEQKRNYIQTFLNILNPVHNATFMQEEVPIYEVTFNHASNSPLSKEEFTNRIQRVCNKFGAIITRVSKYRETNTGKNPTIQGHVYVSMYSAVFTIPLTSMVADEILGIDRAILRIPNQMNIDIFSLSRDAKMSNIMKNWLAANDLDIHLSKNKWIGPKADVDKAIDLLRSSPPHFPTKIVSISGGVDLQSLNAALKSQAKKGNKKWILNLARRKLTVPSETNDEEVKAFINKYKILGKEDEEEDNDEEEFLYIGDVGYCEDEELSSTRLVNFYKSNGRVQTKNFCRSCIRESLVYMLGKMFDDDSDTPIMNRIFENVDFIPPIPLFLSPEGKFIPLGQLMWSLVGDLDVAMPARTYLTALALQTLKKSPCVTCCPQHQNILFRRPPPNTGLKCIISGCKYQLCSDCNKWHIIGSCPEKTQVPLGDRICPYCKAIIEKSEACNHLACNCGKHFCYYCGAGPWDSSGPCYDHLHKEHNGYGNDPPDYRKFIKHQKVSDAELEEFYRKYPHLKNLRA